MPARDVHHPEAAIPFDRRIAGLAMQQDRVVTRQQLIDQGLSKGAIRRRLDSGHLFRVLPAHYAVGVPLLDQRMLLRTALLRGGPASGIVDLAAASYLGLTKERIGLATVASPRRGLARTARPELRMTAGHGPGGPIRPMIYTRLASDLGHLVVVEGLPVTSVSRTLVDLAARSPELFDNAWNEAEYQRTLDVDAIRGIIDRSPRAGAKRLRRALDAHQAIDAGDHGFDDISELAAVKQLLTRRIPAPDINHWFAIEGQRFRADLYWRQARLIVELDSWAGHGTQRAFERDRDRDNAFLGIGILTMRFSRRRFRDHPTDCADKIDAIITQRTGQLAVA